MTLAGPDLAPRNAVDLFRPLACDRLSEDDPPPPWDPAAAEARALKSPAVPELLYAREVEALYRRHHRLVFRIALRYGGGSTAWAEDITQDVFVDLCKAIPTLNALDDLEGWLYRATTNRCFNRLRRERFLSLAPVRWLLGEQRPEPRLPDALAIAHDDLRRLLPRPARAPAASSATAWHARITASSSSRARMPACKPAARSSISRS